jgi:hypothetical protein
MKKILLIAIMFLVIGHVNLVAQIGATGPLITEYVAGAGAGNYSFIEVYNGTGEDLFLEDYTIIMSPNGKYYSSESDVAWGQIHKHGFPQTDPVTGEPLEDAETVVLAPGEIYLYMNENAFKVKDSILPNLPKTGVYIFKSDWIAHIDNWNGGGPAVTFVYIADANAGATPVDIVGVPEARTAANEWGEGWGGLKKVFSRKADITSPTDVFNSGEWNVANAGSDDFDIALLAGIGFHPNTVLPGLSSDATLSSITPSAGTLSPAFDAAVMDYVVTLPAGSTAVPSLTAVATDDNAVVIITDAADLSGTSTIKVTAEDDVTQLIYNVTFLVAQIGATGPLITEYVAGAGHGNYSFIEIYNGTGEDLFLEDYTIIMSPNGKYYSSESDVAWGQIHKHGFPETDPVTGESLDNGESVVLAPGEIYLYMNENAFKVKDSILPNLPKTGVYIFKSDWIAHIDNWNGGGPAVTFVYIADANAGATPVDIVGVPEARTAANEWGAGWGGLKKVFSRKADITSPTDVFNSGEWNVTVADSAAFNIALLAGIGFHPNPAGTTNVRRIQKDINSLKVYPNPASNGTIYLESASEEELNIRIFDLRGALIMQRTIANNQRIDVSGLAKGTYILNAVINNESINRKLFIK